MATFSPTTYDQIGNFTWTDTGGVDFNTATAGGIKLYIGGVLTSSLMIRTATSLIFNAFTYAPGSYSVRVTADTILSSYDVTAGASLTVTCFVEGTKILTSSNKQVKIEDLKIGDEIKTFKHGNKKILHINKRTFKNDKTYSQICRFPNGLMVTGGHSMLVDELSEREKEETIKTWNELKMVDNKYLLLSCINDKCERVNDEKEYKLYHLILENDDEYGQYGIYAEDILTETMSINCYLNNQGGLSVV